MIRELEKSWADKHKVDSSWEPRASSVTEELLWLPVTPDKQFCFNLDWYSGCPLGKIFSGIIFLLNKLILS